MNGLAEIIAERLDPAPFARQQERRPNHADAQRIKTAFRRADDVLAALGFNHTYTTDDETVVRLLVAVGKTENRPLMDTAAARITALRHALQAAVTTMEATHSDQSQFSDMTDAELATLWASALEIGRRALGQISATDASEAGK